MIASTSFVVGAGDNDSCSEVTSTSEEVYPFGEIIKEVWNGSAWVDSTYANIGDTVRFRITIIYHETDHPDATSVRNVIVVDTLPDSLDYADNANIEPNETSGKTLTWRFYGPFFSDETDTCVVKVLEFDANVIGYTDEDGDDNFVEVTGLEKCSSRSLYGNDTATVIVPEPECGTLEVTKKVWNGSEWVDDAVVEHGIVTFNITITYHAGCGYVATDIQVIDYITLDGVSYTYVGSNYEPSYIAGDTIYWNLTEDYSVELSDGESVYIELELSLTAGYGTLDNCVEVYALEECCDCELCAGDCASVTVEEPPCEPGIDVIKKVWNGSAWTEFVDGLKLDDIVKFKIEVIYHACDDYKILNMIIVDELPCCLEYVDTTSITTTGTMDPADIIVDPDGKVITWDWTYNNGVELVDGDSLTIEFTAVVANYCEEISENWVYVEAWGCSGPTFYGEDNAVVDCTPPIPKFFKKAFDGQEWVDEINVSKGETIKFKLELEYYGETPLEEVKFVDLLPCILEYADNVASNRNLTVELSENGKTIWFNLTDDIVEDGDIVTITFDAYVNGTTGECCECEYVENYAYVTGKIGCVEEPNFFMEDWVKIVAHGNCPPTIPAIKGPTAGVTDEELTFYFLSTDPDDDQIYYMIDFDGDTTSYLGPYTSGNEISQTYTFTQPGTYKIKAKAKDINGAESGWTPAGYEHVIVITKAPNATKELTVKMGIFGIGRVKATITNTGDVNLTDINWEINATGGILKRVKIYNNGTIEALNKGENTKIYSSKRMFGRGSSQFGFGGLLGTVKLTAGDYETTHDFKGFVLGKLILIL